MTNKISETTAICLQAIIMIILLFGISMLLQGCTDKCEATVTYTYYEPVYTSFEEVRSSVMLQEPVPMHNPGKIYIYEPFIFISEIDKGIHVVDNSNPSQPEIATFINIPGNSDMAVRDSILYADSYMDLVLFDFSDVNNIQLVNRVEGVLNSMDNMGFMTASDMGVITDWKEMESVNEYDSDCGGNPSLIRFDRGFFATSDVNFLEMVSSSKSSSPSPGPNTGLGGSMARFTIQNQHLYTINDFEMNVINIAIPEAPNKENTVNLGWGIETIFPYNNSLFIGTQTGMQIYDISNPSAPSFLSTFDHVRSCDPVVVEDDFAYVTLRSGTECDGFTNQLDVLDISDLTNPQLLKTYPMKNPHGLGILQNTLFICEGEYGLKVFDASDKLIIDDNMISHFDDIHAYDVIPNGETLILIGKDGLYQYDYSNLEDIKLLSFLSIVPQNFASNGRR